MRQGQARDFDITPWGSGRWSVAPKDISIYSPCAGPKRSADLFGGTLKFREAGLRRRLTFTSWATVALLVLSALLVLAIFRQLG